MDPQTNTIFRIRFEVPNPETLARVINDFKLDMGTVRPIRGPNGSLRVEAYIPEEILSELQKTSLAIEVIENASEVGRQRQKQVVVGDPFEGGRIAPRGLGKKE